MTYLPEMEALWRQTVKKKIGKGRRRSRTTLRGRAFVDELLRFHRATFDEIFRDAAAALFKHGIVDDRGNFTRLESPIIEKLKRHKELEMMRCVRLEIKGGRTLHRACAETAARTGHPASASTPRSKTLKINTSGPRSNCRQTRTARRINSTWIIGGK